eukprot:2651260-Prymnesium_polylepis.1
MQRIKCCFVRAIVSARARNDVLRAAREEGGGQAKRSKRHGKRAGGRARCLRARREEGGG